MPISKGVRKLTKRLFRTERAWWDLDTSKLLANTVHQFNTKALETVTKDTELFHVDLADAPRWLRIPKSQPYKTRMLESGALEHSIPGGAAEGHCHVIPCPAVGTRLWAATKRGSGYFVSGQAVNLSWEVKFPEYYSKWMLDDGFHQSILLQSHHVSARTRSDLKNHLDEVHKVVPEFAISVRRRRSTGTNQFSATVRGFYNGKKTGVNCLWLDSDATNSVQQDRWYHIQVYIKFGPRGRSLVFVDGQLCLDMYEQIGAHPAMGFFGFGWYCRNYLHGKSPAQLTTGCCTRNFSIRSITLPG